MKYEVQEIGLLFIFFPTGVWSLHLIEFDGSAQIGHKTLICVSSM